MVTTYKKENNYAYIDAANLHKGVESLGWPLDGDYASLVKFLQEKEKLSHILSPRSADKCSMLLKRTNAPISYLDDQKSILSIVNEKAPDGDGTP